MIGDALNTAQSISNFGMLAVTAGFFLVLSAILMVTCFKWFMRVINKDVYAGTLRKINGSWYGVLVGESNTLAGQLSIKLQADGTIVEGTV